jgi:hypothetical protein
MHFIIAATMLTKTLSLFAFSSKRFHCNISNCIRGVLIFPHPVILQERALSKQRYAAYVNIYQARAVQTTACSMGKECSKARNLSNKVHLLYLVLHTSTSKH